MTSLSSVAMARACQIVTEANRAGATPTPQSAWQRAIAPLSCPLPPALSTPPPARLLSPTWVSLLAPFVCQVLKTLPVWALRVMRLEIFDKPSVLSLIIIEDGNVGFILRGKSSLVITVKKCWHKLSIIDPVVSVWWSDDGTRYDCGYTFSYLYSDWSLSLKYARDGGHRGSSRAIFISWTVVEPKCCLSLSHQNMDAILSVCKSVSQLHPTASSVFPNISPIW